MFSVKAKARDLKISLDSVRKVGEMPAVFYGVGVENTPISVGVNEFKKVWHKAGESSAVKISMPEKDIDVLIHEVQTDPVTDEPIHADFLAIDMNKKIKVKVPLEFEGVSPAVKNALGNLVKVLHEVEIEALPKDLPHNLVVDISTLEDVENTVLVSAIKLPVGVEMITGSSDVVASIIKQVEEKEEEVIPVDLSTIEVEKKGKKEEESEAPEANAGGEAKTPN